MLQKKVFDIYKNMFSMGSEEIESWIANGPNSIRIRMKSKKEIVFTYKNKTRWKLESRESFIDTLCDRNNKK